MQIQSKSHSAPLQPDLRFVSHKVAQHAHPAPIPIGFTRRELRRLVAEMID